MRIQLLIT